MKSTRSGDAPEEASGPPGATVAGTSPMSSPPASRIRTAVSPVGSPRATTHAVTGVSSLRTGRVEGMTAVSSKTNGYGTTPPPGARSRARSQAPSGSPTTGTPAKGWEAADGR